MIKSVPGQPNDPFGIQREFIQNIGQYGDTLSGFGHMGPILYGYEGSGMPVLFTRKGWIHLQRKVNLESMEEMEREREERERKGNKVKPEDEWEKPTVKDGAISMEWMGSNPAPKIIAENKSSAYHSYGYLKQAASSFKKITYQNLYPGIDLVFSFTNDKDHGFEYSLVVHPGSDLKSVQLKIGGSYKRIRKRLDGSLFISSPLGDINISAPISYYSETILSHKPSSSNLKSVFELDENNKEINFVMPAGYDASKTLIIDPFVTGTGSLTGLNLGKAKDVDFDYAGNIYVTGGGDPSVHKLAKYDAAGNLLWTFSGTLTLPSWSFGTYWGGWMVEKPTGNIYLGQGFNPNTGFQVIRVSTTGLYDNFITTANANFREAWRMLWSCNNGSPQILVAGGGTNSNINFGVFTPPATAIGSLNVTGIPYTGSAGWAQDIVDFVIDPSNNDMYTLYGSLFGNPSLNNRIYKNTFPYSGASVAWNIASGFTTVQEVANRPYLLGGQIDNSANIFAINSSYLFYWDGKNLKAFDKATGNTVGTPLVTANTALMQGGIIADACNNVFIGDGNGVIKVYKFNGSNFDDGAAGDINIPGYSGKAVYDIAYDESKKLLYASGDGFVFSFDISAYCPATQYSLIATPNCLTASATITVNPAPPAGSTVSFTLYNGTTIISTNTTGIFTGLLPGITYTVTATINQACSGQQATTTFVIPGPVITTSSTNTTCGNATGTITATGSGSTAPYTYSIDGTNYQASGNFTGLAAGVYTVYVKDAAGCITTKTITILNSNGPTVSVVSTNADCGNNNGTIKATVTGGTAPYQYSLNGGPYQGSDFFTGLVGGIYTLTVKDALGCTNVVIITITSSPSPSISAIPATATCGSSNGSITAFGSGGTAPLEYSINGNIFQASGSFVNLTPGTYTVTVRDVNGCTQTTSVTIGNSPAPTITAVATAATCNNVNGIITATGTGGLAPLQYSINGTIFQTSNIFTGLAAGTYTVTVKDASGCTNIVSVSVGTIGGPSVTATSTTSACNANTGTITAIGSGGTGAYTYSINGINFQVSGVFAGLAAGNYVVYVRDANGCIGTFTVVVTNTAGPSITASGTTTACNANTGTITAIGAGGTAPLQYSIDGANYQASNIFTGLATGLYTVYVKDANGCTRITTVTIINTSNLSLTVSTLFTSCSSNSGTITATATGGISPLTYSIDGTNYFANNIFTGVAAGVYPVSVKDANGCIVTRQVTVQSASGPTLTLTKADATCGAANGVITANGVGGVAPLTYSLDGGPYQSIRIFINVSTGPHTVTVKDANGCTASQTITINNTGAGTPPTDVTFRVRDALACTGNLGRIKNLKGEPSGGGIKYTFSLDFGPFTNANQFTNVAPGVHTVTAMNEDGCTITKIVTIGSGAAATATATVTPAACNTPNGSITISGVGVNTPYHASIDGGANWVTFFPPGANSTTFAGLAPGTYPIIMADDADFTAGPPDNPGACLTTQYFVVPSSNGPSINTTQINGTCNAPNGSITAVGSGGTAPYSYNINGGPYFASGVFNNLPSGTYAVGVMDGTGCTSGANIILTNAPNPTVTAIATATSCNLDNGTITANGAGGTAPLQYSINGTTFQSSNVFNNLAAGTYTVYVGDGSGCFGTTTVTIIKTAIPKVTAFTIAATCNNNDGSIVATGTLGQAPYSYSIDGIAYQSSNTFSNLAAGFYTIYIKDARGCVSTTGISVSNTQAPTISNTVIVPANCNLGTGSISITATGGTAPLQYSIDGINFSGTILFTNLIPGNYTVFVRDATGCMSTKAVIVGNVVGPQTLTATILNAACGQANGSITASATGGTAPLQYSLDGVTYQASTLFTNKSAGTYTLYVKDANGCIKTLQVVLINLPGPIVSTSSSPASCGSSDGSITADVNGGTGAITYSIDGINFQASNIFTGLAAGTYTITVKDARGCINTTAANINTSGSSITPVFAPVGPICSGRYYSSFTYNILKWNYWVLDTSNK
ncbi:MAG: SprB repeat-containing protein [Chitinophagaceae bacterium]|nr:SprB repeat-containing protein [Chitinophagaceae bacterium]